MIERYSRPDMSAIWSEEGKYRRWLDVELAVCEVQTERGLIPEADMAAIRTEVDPEMSRDAFREDTVTLAASQAGLESGGMTDVVMGDGEMSPRHLYNHVLELVNS